MLAAEASDCSHFSEGPCAKVRSNGEEDEMADTTTGTSTTSEAPFRRHSETICEAAASEAPIAQVPIAMWMREERLALSNSSWRIDCGGSLDASGVIGFGFSAAEAELPLSRRRGLAGGVLPLVDRLDGLVASIETSCEECVKKT
jgi:hypothetical protein